MASIKKRVAIIGAGPGGLIAAHKILQTGKLSITIFEKGHRIGGLWAADSLINPEMRTNSSMFTAAFSDLSWESVYLDGQPAPVYPKAWMVERYLQEYARRFVLAGQEKGEQRLLFGARVTSAARVMEKWRIATLTNDATGEVEKIEYFDYLVLATGYLSDLKPLDCEIDQDCSVPIIHSTEYRHLHQLGHGSSHQVLENEHRRVLIVGGSHSGSDMAALIAWQASNERWAPGKIGSSSPVEIIHITPHQLFAVPAFSRDYNVPCAFQPLEYKIFDRASRGTDPISHTFAMASPEDSKNSRMMIEGFVNGGVDDSNVDTNDLPPYCVISETYNQLVRNEVIRPIIGQLRRLQKLDDKEDRISAIVVLLNGEEIQLDDFSAVINATGFNSRGSLSFLAKEVQDELSFEPLNSRLPLVLDTTYLCQRSSVPDIALLGFNGVISWGIIEMQSRAVAAKWAAEEEVPIPSDAELEACKTVVDHISAIRAAVRDGRRTEVPQVPFSDYMGMMEQAGRELGLERVDLEFSEVEGFICAARWVDSAVGKTEALKTMARLQDIQRQARDAKLFLARSVFHGLSGKWVSEREYRDGIEYTREVELHPRYPTRPEYHFEYVAIEKFTTLSANSEQTEARHTILRYTEDSDEVSAWEVDAEDARKAKDLPFYKLQFYQNDADDFNSCSAVALELDDDKSEPDQSLSYRFEFKGSMLQSIHIQRNRETLTFRKPTEHAIFELQKSSSVKVARPQPVKISKLQPLWLSEFPSRITSGSGDFADPPFRTGTPFRNELSS
ncbi:hypothetical protein K505DRAFT_250310 [Melanomma pulvis-pyrius CBS 109.77]|uniref:FAD/NAD(P)-binding domain-containing protein n=1 Tax=Melanomma pulvis-pyrius CBS 109.77 TaxID=1314802 RepID=A0A6A6X3Y8_9PLEO|nr:hypothetical protein K505DRAFT_250310 [Melanomma pulvis-pyrius CBS 109.77]